MKKISFLPEKDRLRGFVDVAMFSAILLFFHFLFRGTRDIFTQWEFYKISNELLSNILFHHVGFLVDLTKIPFESFDILTSAGETHRRAFLYLGKPEGNVVYVSWSCSGFKQFYQWIFLMVFFPGPWKHKLWYIPLGLMVIYIVNVFRIYALLITAMYAPEKIHFVHDDILRPFFYVVMFALWVYWNDKIRLPRLKKKR